MRARVALVAIAVSTLSACGSTVQLANQPAETTAPSGADGLSVQSTIPTQIPDAGQGTSSAPHGSSQSSGGSTAPSTGKTTAVPSATIHPGGGSPTEASSGHAPITVGLAYVTSNPFASSLGASESSTLSPLSATTSLVQAINAKGGFDGHRLILDKYGFNPADNNFSVDAQAACEQFHLDNHVSVVIDEAFGIQGGFATCLQHAGILDIASGGFETDASAARALTLFVNVFNMTIDRTYATMVRQLARTGYVTPASRLGVVMDSCAYTKVAYNETIAPLIKRLGLHVVHSVQVTCGTGYNQLAVASAQIADAVLAFKATGVNRVMMISNSESIGFLLFAEAASSQNYRPGYMLTSNGEAEALLQDVSASQRPQFRGVGVSPMLDITGAKVPLTPVERLCEHLLVAGGGAAHDYNDHLFEYEGCSPLLLLRKALVADGGDLSATSLVDAINHFGDSYSGPEVYKGATSFSAAKHDAPREAAIFSYVASCRCLRYISGPLPTSS